jgi:hypothetical protein
MVRKQNCWEFKKCGREPGGAKVPELGACRAATDTIADGLNGGKNGGRICWAVAGSYSNLDIPDSTECIHAVERFSCINCEFFALVEKEEGPANFHILKPGQVFLF